MIKEMGLYSESITCGRARTLVDQVVRPSIYTDHVPLSVEVFQVEAPISHDEAIAASYQPVSLGFEWGPVWSTAWFRLRGSVPSDWDDSFRLMFDTKTEALCWWNAAPYQGVELHRQDVKLPSSVKPGDDLEVYIEAACNHMSGVGSKFAGGERMGDFPIRQGGKLTLAHVARFHAERAALWYDLDTLTRLVDLLPAQSPRLRHAAEALRETLCLIDADDLDGTLDAARERCREGLEVGAAPSANTAYCVGNAHIDLAWLWPIRETKRKASRSFSTVLRYMERHPEYRFVQSQPQLYDWVRQDYPELFKGIQKQVREGRWEAAGAMWVEADCNIPNGESLVRQILVGTTFFEEHFDSPQKYLWLPDVFGYSAALPQILKGCGLDAFITQKISWNQFNKFPYHSFNWVGIDGTSIPSHFLPADTYIGQNTPDEFALGDRQYGQSAQLPAWLQAYGWGDGGGGPTEASIERVNRIADCEGMPRARHASVQNYVDRLTDSVDRLPTWVGELYLELHRGTYTSQSKLKRGNRKGEVCLKEVELAQALLGSTSEQRAEIDRLWKLLLLNQFHDIIPGSSIEWVNREAEAAYLEVIEGCEKLLASIAGEGEMEAGEPWMINTRSHGQGGLIEVNDNLSVDPDALPQPVQETTDLNGHPLWLVHVPDTARPGIEKLGASDPVVQTDGNLSVSSNHLENNLLRVEFDTMGCVSRLYDKQLDREAVDPRQSANRLMLFDDRPISWDAWDIEVYYRESGRQVTTPVETGVVEDGPLRVAIEFRREVGQASSLIQRVQLGLGDRHVTFDTQVEWEEERKLLRVEHPVDVRSESAAFEIQYGYVRRPTHFNTSWDYARFESAAQRWIDLSQSGFGVSLINDCKYGHSCHGNVMGISLLRSPKEPDPKADIGTHKFRYALAPHGGFDAAYATRLAERFNQPPRILCRPKGINESFQLPLTIDGVDAKSIGIEAVKPAEDGNGVIVRLRELNGGVAKVRFVTKDRASIRLVNLIERDLNAGEISSGEQFEFNPFQLVTLRLA